MTGLLHRATATIVVAGIFTTPIGTDASELLSAGPTGMPASNMDQSTNPDVSEDGRYVIFSSTTTTLVAGDSNVDGNGRGIDDVYRLDRDTGDYVWVSQPEDGATIPDGPSTVASISDDGRYVVFESMATNLVAGDSNDNSDVFLRDIETGQTIRVSAFIDTLTQPAFASDPVISGDGSTVALVVEAGTFPNTESGIYLYDVATGQERLASESRRSDPRASYARAPALSRDGTRLAFVGTTEFLTDDPGDMDDPRQVYLLDTVADTLTIVSRDANGELAESRCFEPEISADGRYVAAFCWANFGFFPPAGPADDRRAAVFRFDAQTGDIAVATVDRLGEPSESTLSNPLPIAISADGSRIAFNTTADLSPADIAEIGTLFVRDLAAGHTTIASTRASGAQPASGRVPRLARNGDYIVFTSDDAAEPGVDFFQEVFGRSVAPTAITATVASGDANTIILSNNGTETATLPAIVLTDDREAGLDGARAPEGRCGPAEFRPQFDRSTSCVFPPIAPGGTQTVPLVLNAGVSDLPVFVIPNEVNAAGNLIELSVGEPPPPPPPPPPVDSGGGGGGAFDPRALIVLALMSLASGWRRRGGAQVPVANSQ